MLLLLGAFSCGELAPSAERASDAAPREANAPEAATLHCASDSDCPDGSLCGYPIEEGCAATGRCVAGNYLCGRAPFCGCDNRTGAGGRLSKRGGDKHGEDADVGSHGLALLRSHRGDRSKPPPDATRSSGSVANRSHHRVSENHLSFLSCVKTLVAPWCCIFDGRHQATRLNYQVYRVVPWRSRLTVSARDRLHASPRAPPANTGATGPSMGRAPSVSAASPHHRAIRAIRASRARSRRWDLRTRWGA